MNSDKYRGGSRGNGFRSGGGFQGRKEKFRATCATCGSSCEVPFKPNGRKPVLCSDCFQDDQGYDARPRHDKRPRHHHDDRAPKHHKQDSQTQEELVKIRRKLDYIIKILESVEVIEDIDE